MDKFNVTRVFTQYRDVMKPYEPVQGRRYTITHSDTSGELFIFIAADYARDQFTDMRDEVRISWKRDYRNLFLAGTVLVDGIGENDNAELRNRIFYDEMPTALQALRQADRFLFEKHMELDYARVYIEFVSKKPMYHKTFDFGPIGDYR